MVPNVDKDLGAKQRTIRSFVRRKGRLGIASRDVLHNSATQCWVQGQSVDVGVIAQKWQNHPGRRVVDIGFGAGDDFLQSARLEPSTLFLGIEVFPAGVAHVVKQAEFLALANVCIAGHDCLEVLPHLPAQSVDCIRLLYPDPWPKNKHKKRRLVDAFFCAAVARVLRDGGGLHLVSDWPEYLVQASMVLAAHGFVLAQTPHVLPRTRYYRKALEQGRPIGALFAMFDSAKQ